MRKIEPGAICLITPSPHYPYHDLSDTGRENRSLMIGRVITISNRSPNISKFCGCRFWYSKDIPVGSHGVVECALLRIDGYDPVTERDRVAELME